MSNIRVQHSVPSLAQAVQVVEGSFAKYREPHVTFVDPPLFPQVIALVVVTGVVCVAPTNLAVSTPVAVMVLVHAVL